MPQALPPLNCLRAFEAAARHLSFKDAARELHVTPAAVGHQIKKLEAHLGVNLFNRFNRGIALTAVGRSMIPELTEGFGLLARASEKARTSGDRTVLTITVAPSFAAKWLIPRLQEFHVGQQEITVRIDTGLREIDMASNGIDVAIRFGAGRYPGHRVDRLMGEMLIPVCSPRLEGSQLGLRTPNDLSGITLLHIEGETADMSWADWPVWLKKAGCMQVNGDVGPRFSQSMMAVQAAIEGQGVALAPASIVAADIDQGRLLRLFKDIDGLPTSFAYYVVSPRSVADSREVVIFRSWLMEEVERMGQ